MKLTAFIQSSIQSSVPLRVLRSPAGKREYSTRYSLRRKAPPRRVLIVGNGEMGQGLAREIKDNLAGHYVIVGFVTNGSSAEAGELRLEEKELGRREDIAELVQQHQIEEVVIADCRTEKAATLHFTVPAEVAQRDGAHEMGGVRHGVKRLCDVLVASGALILMAPMAGVLAMAIKATSPGPVFYLQERVGQDGRTFTIFKFRTLYEQSETKTGPVLTYRNQDQVTRLGKLLRATHLDECPQFYNVLRGDMSTIGPRPERPCFVEPYSLHISAYSLRHVVRPGITGLAQINSSYLSHPYVKLHYDLTYVHNQSFLLDSWILLRTPISIIRSLFVIRQELP
jgi:lipopolysaccharide/colanic/teichoic acid biosynthesis glycosyltransferase